MNKAITIFAMALSTSCAPVMHDQRLSSAINVGLCSAIQITPDIKSMFDTITSGDISQSEKILSGILSGTGAIAKSMACYMKDLATTRSQSGELSASRRSDDEIMQSRASYCDPASQAYNIGLCKPKNISAYVIMLAKRDGKIVDE